MTKVKMICKSCRSEDVVKDAWAGWCIERQKWVLDQEFDEAFCNTCQEACSIEEVALDA